MRAIVVSRHGGFGRGEDGVLVLADGVRREAAVLLRHAHRASRGVEAKADLPRCRDFGREQVARLCRVDVEVVGRSRAAAQREFGEADEGREVDGLLVEERPAGVKNAQPVEQPRTDRRGERAGEVLVDVMVGVDKARCHQAPVSLQPSFRRRFALPLADADDEAVVDRHPAPPQLGRAVHRDKQFRAGNNQVDGAVGVGCRCDLRHPTTVVPRLVLRPRHWSGRQLRLQRAPAQFGGPRPGSPARSERP